MVSWYKYVVSNSKLEINHIFFYRVKQDMKLNTEMKLAYKHLCSETAESREKSFHAQSLQMLSSCLITDATG